jgi:hypothetical protein
MNTNGLGCNPTNGTGKGASGTFLVSGGGGGGYAGVGGTGYNLGGSGGSAYYSASFLSAGSGGGCSAPSSQACNLGGFGGGIISIHSQIQVILNGNLSANGERGNYCGGGGSGGSIFLSTSSFKGNGFITAAGGVGGSCPTPGGGGGGGTIKIQNIDNDYAEFTFSGPILSGGGAPGQSVVNMISYSPDASGKMQQQQEEEEEEEERYESQSMVSTTGYSSIKLADVVQAQGGAPGVINMPVCPAGTGNNPSLGQICVECEVGYYSVGTSSGSCIRCNNAPTHSTYTDSGWKDSDCPFQCNSGYSTDKCLNQLQIFIYSTLTIPGLAGCLIGLFALILLPLLYYRNKKYSDWEKGRDTKTDFFKKVMFLDVGDEGNNKTTTNTDSFMVENPLNASRKKYLEDYLENGVKHMQIRKLAVKRGKELRREHRMVDQDMIFHACRINLLGQNHPSYTRGKF